MVWLNVRTDPPKCQQLVVCLITVTLCVVAYWNIKRGRFEKSVKMSNEGFKANRM